MPFEKRSTTRTVYGAVQTANASFSVMTERTDGPANERRPVACLLVAVETASKRAGHDAVNMRLDSRAVRDLYVSFGEVLDVMDKELRAEADKKGAT